MRVSAPPLENTTTAVAFSRRPSGVTSRNTPVTPATGNVWVACKKYPLVTHSCPSATVTANRRRRKKGNGTKLSSPNRVTASAGPADHSSHTTKPAAKERPASQIAGSKAPRGATV